MSDQGWELSNEGNRATSIDQLRFVQVPPEELDSLRNQNAYNRANVIRKRLTAVSEFPRNSDRDRVCGFGYESRCLKRKSEVSEIV